jgi:D-sedoheptulose 7-phosphate isomerase
MSDDIKFSLQQAYEASAIYLKSDTAQFIQEFVEMLTSCFQKGGKLLVCGNGGSLCDAMHVAEEFTGQFRKPRQALPALALADPAHMSCVGNDRGFDQVFARGVEAFGKRGDVLLILSTSGSSSNLIEAFKVARLQELTVVCLLGKGGGLLKGLGDLELIVEGFKYSDRIQEVHMTLMHIVIEACENRLFYHQELCLQ